MKRVPVPSSSGLPSCTSSGRLNFRLKRENANPRYKTVETRRLRQPEPILTDRDARRGETLLLMDLKVITPTEAQQLLGVGRSQIYRLLARYRRGGISAIASKRHGTPSNRAYPSMLKMQVLAIIEDRYSDFGPTLVSEMLREVHDINISRETLRTWMTQAGIWVTNRATRKRMHQPRKRMPMYGDLVQIDGSDHEWLEGRGPRCTAMVMVDDATGQLQVLQFFPRENRDAYFQATYSYIASHDRPLRIVTDRHSAVWLREGPTEYTHALKNLGILHSFAYSPQSKGRVERIHRTLQDRLVKAMRIKNICTIEEANAFVPGFIRATTNVSPSQPLVQETATARHDAKQMWRAHFQGAMSAELRNI